MPKIFFLLFILIYSSVNGQNTDLGGMIMENRNSSYNKFNTQVAHNYHSLIEKYSLKEHQFDPECIYENGDLTKLILELLEIGDFKSGEIREGHDSGAGQIYTSILIDNKEYIFKTSDNSDYVDLNTIMPVLKELAQNLKPEFDYNISSYDTGLLSIIFAKRVDLQKAIDEGFPCSLESGRWELEKRWENGLYSDIEIDIIPDLEKLRNEYVKTIQNLKEKGFNVRKVTEPRIYLYDYLDRINIAIDGNSYAAHSNEILDNKIRCSRDGWGVLLAYTLVKSFGGKPSLFDKKENKNIDVSEEEFLKRVELAFREN